MSLSVVPFYTISLKTAEVRQIIYRMNFELISTSCAGVGAAESQFSIDLVGCECSIGDCTAANGCSCLPFGDNYDYDQLLIDGADAHPIVECGRLCKCAEASSSVAGVVDGRRCGNRLVQNGIRYRLSLFHDDRKGIGVKADEPIPR